MKATVLMPAYNAEAYIKEAIESALTQSFDDYDLLIINDGSTDNTENVIKQFNSSKIRYKTFESNIGLIAVLNYGIGECTTEYLIRMDADDVSHPQRFEKQIAFMDANKDIAISGTWFSFYGTSQIVSHPITTEECNVTLLKKTVLGHPSVIIRTQAVKEFGLTFKPWALHAEDYLFWAEAAIHGLKMANIPEVLLHYRIHDEQVSAKKRDEQDQSVKKVIRWYGSQFFHDIIVRDFELYFNFLNGQIRSFEEFQKAKIIVAELKAQNIAHGFFEHTVFDSFIDTVFKEALRNLYSWKADKLMILLKTITDLQFLTATSMRIKVRYMLRSLKTQLIGS